MKQLSELLREAKADAPPQRLGIDDVVAAGRTRRRRRNSGWAVTAVVAVAAAIGVPQILARPDTRKPVLPAEPSPSPPSKLLALDALSRPFSVGDLRIQAPDTVGLDGSMAEIRRAGQEVGRLWILSPEITTFPWGSGTTLDTTTIDGRPAKWVRATKDDEGPEYLIWESVDGATVLVWPGTQMTRSQGQAVAEAFTPGPARPATIGFRVAEVPAEYRLITATTVAGRPEPMGMTFLGTEAAEARLRDARPFGSLTEPPANSLNLSMTPARESEYPDGEIRCADRDCYLWRKSAGVLFHATGDVRSDLRTVLRSAVPATDVGDRTTWFRVDDAVPVTARLERP